MTAEGYVYELIFEGPADNSPDTLRRLKGVFIADLNLSVEEVQSILQATPTTIFRSDDKDEVQRCMGALKSAGAKVLLVAPKADTTEAPAATPDSAENGAGYVIEFDLNDEAPQPPKEPKTYSLDPLPDDTEPNCETEILDLNAAVLDQSEAAQESDLLSLDEEPITPKQSPSPAPDNARQNTKKTPSMLGSSPLIAAPDAAPDFGFALDDEAAVIPSAVSSKAAIKASISPDAPVIPADVAAKQPTIPSTTTTLDETAGLDELLAIAEQNEDKQNLFDDLAIRELDEQNLIESAVKNSDDDFSLDLKPDAPSKVQARPAEPAAGDTTSKIESAQKVVEAAPTPQKTPPVAPTPSAPISSAVTETVVATPQPSVAAVEAKSSESTSVQTVVAAQPILESQSTNSPHQAEPASNRIVIIAAAAAVALFVLGNWFYLYVYRSSEVTNEDMLQVLPKSTIEKHAAKVEGASEEGVKKPPAIVGDAKTVTINDSSNARTIQAKFKLQADKPLSVMLVLTTPKPPEQTPEQIVHNEPAPLWLEKLETEELNFTQNESGKLIARGAAKLYITQAGNNSRAVAQVEIESSFDAQKGELEANISAFTADAPADKNEELLISKDGTGAMKITISTHVKAAV